jgi:tetratricopeptide (TPR) repeat protein/tRNA A-37 threonylcarbamoyl transferase component Bud32
MGEVYLAEDTALGRSVALKILPESSQQDPMARKRLLREARAAAALNHPNSCTVHEVGEVDGQAFIVMEYVEGETLAQAIARRRFDLLATLQIFDQVAAALAEAHDKGIVHRDLKPSNVMITRQGQAKVMDFGLAAATMTVDTVTDLTTAGATIGTLAYMAPEQINGGVADVRSDVFAFGVALYEALSGTHPFARPSGVATAAAILTEAPPPLARCLPTAPPALEKIVARLLAKDPSGRYQSMQEVRAALALADSGSGASLPPGRSPHTWLRWPAVVAFVIVAALAIWALLRFWPTTPALAFAARDWIIVADFDNRTGDAVFDRSLDMAMAVSIQQSKYVNVVPRSRIQQTLALMRKADAPRLDESLARDVAVRDGIKALLVCRISQVGDAYALTAELIDPATQLAVTSEGTRAANRNGILAALDELARRIRARLGESLASIASQHVALPLATTSSLEALKAFAESRKPGAKAVEALLKQAIELDPDFAMAHADLGVLYYTQSDRPPGEEHFQKALSLLDRLTARERLWIAAVADDWRGNREQGIERYRTYVAQYPDDASAWFRLGYAYLVTSQPSRAIDAFQHDLALNPVDSAAMVNVATALSVEGENDKAVAAYQRAFAIDGSFRTADFVNGEYGFLLARMGRTAEAEETFKLMLTSGLDTKKARGLRSLGLLAMYRGRYSEAVGFLTDAANLNRTGHVGLSELRDRLFLVSVQRTRGRQTEANKELEAAVRLTNELKLGISWLYETGKALVRAGHIDRATGMLRTATARLGDMAVVTALNQSNRTDEATVKALSGEIELGRRRIDAAIALFEEADRLQPDTAGEALARAFQLRGDLDKAIVLYRQLIARRFLGSESTEPSLLAHVQLGRIFEARHDLEAARREYETFLDLWKDGDSDLPVIVDTKQRVARLNTAPR